MSRWFRFYDDAVNDPKLIKLSDDIFRAWVNLLCVASKNDGALPATDDIAIILRVKCARAAAIITELVSFGLLDKTETGFTPHNWDGRQFKSDVSNERVKRYRERKRNVTDTVTEPVTVTGHSVSVSDSVSVSVSKKEETRKIEFEDFWNHWPNKVGKPAAVKALASARKRGVPIETIMEGVRRYVRDKPPDRSWMNPATFLNGNRWEDRPAPMGSSDAKPLTQHQRDQQETRDILNELGNFARGGSGSDTQNLELLPDHSSGRSESLRGGAGQNVIDLPRSGYRSGG